MKVVGIIPAFNEGERVLKVVKGTKKYLDEVIVIDDGSSDKTVEYAEKAGAIVINHPHNLGKGAACRSGFYAAIKLGCDAIIMLDGDGQHACEDIPLFLDAAKKAELAGKSCIILGNRMSDVRNMPMIRRLTNTTLSLLLSFLAKQKISDSQCGFRFIHRQILEKVDYENNRYDAESEILVRASRAGFAIKDVPIQTIYSDEFSKINVFWDTLRFVRFFFKHLLYSPPISESEGRNLSISLGKSVLEEK
ncbi:MAG: glycosyltransferase family 2 protein [Planctomycetes bacterium]|nr:glycosyltransferase family 2 protein [Planctomycetota bacterium]